MDKILTFKQLRLRGLHFEAFFRLMICLPLFVCFSCYSANAQQVTDSIQVDAKSKAVKFQSPRKASILSAVLPGAGQIYNKKYWKAPIAWGGIGLCAYYVNFNTVKFKEAKRGLILASDTITGNELPQFFNQNSSQLSKRAEFYRRYRDVSYAFLTLVYVLNIIDAAVDAHLFYFDVTEDVSLHIQPYNNLSAQPAYGLRLALNF